MWTVPLGGSTSVIGSRLNLGRLPVSSFKAPLYDLSPKYFSSGLCGASQVAELLPTISPEVYVREARVEDCWEVAETHCSSFFPEYSFPLDFVLRIDRLIAMLFGFSIPNGCQRTCLVAVVGSRDEEACLLGTEELKLGGFDGRLSLNKGYVTGILTVDTVADFLPRKGPLRKRRAATYLKESIIFHHLFCHHCGKYMLGWKPLDLAPLYDELRDFLEGKGLHIYQMLRYGKDTAGKALQKSS